MPAIAELSVVDWHRLNRLLETALALEPDERTTWLRSLPPAEIDLVPLLQRLLQPLDRTETAQFAAPPPRMAGVRVDEGVAQEQSGQSIGPYRLLRELGQGGMGTVWLAARADGAFERQVALKLPRAEWTDRGLAQRFARERAVLASLNHPNIAQLFDAGWSESGRPYLALEYVEGLSILASCEARQLDIAARLRLLVGVIRAVAHAHARLVVHRDLKPSNVLVTTDGQVKLLDFGIAKLLAGEATAAEETELTRLAGRALTPNYAAPEQILGQPISTAADIYALGVLLFELLTGERPYRLNRDALQLRSALEEAIVRVDPPAPSSVVKHAAVRRALRGDLDAIVFKALRKAPDQRYETAAAFADDIERHLARLPVHAQRAGRAYRLRRFIARNRLAVGAAAGVIAALAVGLSVALWQARTARDEAARANTIKDFVLSIIQQADPVASRQTKEADIALLAAAESRIERELAAQPELALQMRRAIGAAYHNRGEFQRARDVLRLGIEQARTALRPDNLELLGAQVQIAHEFTVDGSKTRDDLDTAIATLRGLGPKGKLLLADALFTRHSLLQWTASPADTIKAAREALHAAHDAGDEGRGIVAATALTETLVEHYKFAEALEVIAAAYDRAVHSGKLDPSDTRLIIAMSLHARALCINGQVDHGISLANAAIAAVRALHGSTASVTEGVLFNVGQAYSDMYESERALELLGEAYSIAVKREPPDSSNRQLRKVFLINVLMRLDRVHEIQRVLEETPLPRRTIGSGVDWRGHSAVHDRIAEARVRLFLGDSATAERLLEEIVPRLDELGAPSMAGHAHRVLVRALLQNGKAKEAEKFALEDLRHARAGSGAGVTIPGSLVSLGEVRLALGNYQSALELAEQADTQFKEIQGRWHPVWAKYLRGRALLKLGDAREALNVLADVDAYWRKVDPASGTAAGASYWHGQALIVNGETARGRALLMEAKPVLAASRFAADRRLAASLQTRAAAK